MKLSCNSKPGTALLVQASRPHLSAVLGALMFGVLVMRGLGGLLLLAAALKMCGLAVEPVGRAGIFSEPWLQTLLVEWEIALGIWLVWGVNRALAWLGATATFLAFAGFTFWQGWIGQSSCGCFGAVRVHPWLAFGVDLAVLLSLAIIGPKLAADSIFRKLQYARPILSISFAIVFTLAILAGTGSILFGSLGAALAYLRGDQMSVEPAFLDLGKAYIGDTIQTRIHVHNWSNRPIRVVGGTSDCSCVVTRDLPMTIGRSGSIDLQISVRFLGPVGQFTRVMALQVDDGNLRIVRLRLTGIAYQPPDSESPER